MFLGALAQPVLKGGLRSAQSGPIWRPGKTSWTGHRDRASDTALSLTRSTIFPIGAGPRLALTRLSDNIESRHLLPPSGVEFELHPLVSRLELSWGIEIQSGHRGPTLWSDPKDFCPRIVVHLKMLCPTIDSRVEQPNYRLGCLIHAGLMVALHQGCGTRPAGECKVAVVISSLLRNRQHMLHLKTEIENHFWCVAVFTTVPGTLRHLGVPRIHEANPSSMAWARAVAARSSAVTSR